MFAPQIKFVCFDFDGVFTDCKFYVDNKGNHFKAYNGKDSYGIKILKERGVKVGLLTSHDSEVIDQLVNNFNHFNKIDLVKRGDQNKIEQLTLWKNMLDLNWNQIAYMGDDLNDLECLKKVGVSACPADASPEIKKICYFVSDNNGGQCAVRDFIRYLISCGSI